NEAYSKFLSFQAITTIFNLAELNFALKREGKQDADRTTKEYEQLLVEVIVDDIFNAMDLRITNRKLSAADAIGYTVALRYNAKFLTGDKEFAKMPNVEFVK
ncbi:MAG: PIN domain-containing protein, partial [Candidatus Diapherotrites archaeon]|nr:PIN domain-containing protein [Candidatus Diapherotrites archaeon]